MESMSAPDMTGSYCAERRKNEKARDFVRKKLRDSGNPYVNRQNISVPGKTPSNVARVCRCSYSCGNITVEDKFRWFHEYYTMDFNGQSEFLASKCMRLMDVKRKRREMSSRRQCSVAYFLPDAESNSMQVCQQTICDTFQITKRRLQYIQWKLKTGVDLADKRGTHSNRPNRKTEMQWLS